MCFFLSQNIASFKKIQTNLNYFFQIKAKIWPNANSIAFPGLSTSSHLNLMSNKLNDESQIIAP